MLARARCLPVSLISLLLALTAAAAPGGALAEDIAADGHFSHHVLRLGQHEADSDKGQGAASHATSNININHLSMVQRQGRTQHGGQGGQMPASALARDHASILQRAGRTLWGDQAAPAAWPPGLETPLGSGAWRRWYGGHRSHAAGAELAVPLQEEDVVGMKTDPDDENKDATTSDTERQPTGSIDSAEGALEHGAEEETSKDDPIKREAEGGNSRAGTNGNDADKGEMNPEGDGIQAASGSLSQGRWGIRELLYTYATGRGKVRRRPVEKLKAHREDGVDVPQSDGRPAAAGRGAELIALLAGRWPEDERSGVDLTT